MPSFHVFGGAYDSPLAGVFFSPTSFTTSATRQPLSSLGHLSFSFIFHVNSHLYDHPQLMTL